MKMMTLEKSEEYIASLNLHKRLNEEDLEKYEEINISLYYGFLRDKDIDFTLDILIDKLRFIVFERMNLFNVLTKEEKDQYEKLVAEENYYNDVPF